MVIRNRAHGPMVSHHLNTLWALRLPATLVNERKVVVRQSLEPAAPPPSGPQRGDEDRGHEHQPREGRTDLEEIARHLRDFVDRVAAGGDVVTNHQRHGSPFALRLLKTRAVKTEEGPPVFLREAVPHGRAQPHQLLQCLAVELDGLPAVFDLGVTFGCVQRIEGTVESCLLVLEHLDEFTVDLVHRHGSGRGRCEPIGEVLDLLLESCAFVREVWIGGPRLHGFGDPGGRYGPRRFGECHSR